MKDIRETDSLIKKNAKGMDWAMLLLYGIFLAEVPLVELDPMLYKVFLIPNAIYLLLLCVMFVKRLKEKNNVIAAGYGLGAIVVALITYLEFSLSKSLITCV